jgi:hypothetical protein
VEETPYQYNAAFFNSVIGYVTDIEQVNEADILLKTFLRPAVPYPAPQHPHRHPSVKDEVENEENEEAVSHQRS